MNKLSKSRKKYFKKKKKNITEERIRFVMINLDVGDNQKKIMTKKNV